MERHHNVIILGMLLSSIGCILLIAGPWMGFYGIGLIMFVVGIVVFITGYRQRALLQQAPPSYPIKDNRVEYPTTYPPTTYPPSAGMYPVSSYPPTNAAFQQASDPPPYAPLSY